MSAAPEPVLDYSAAGVAVRDDLVESQRALLDALRRPGAWFDGAERCAIAAASRLAPSCPLCRERKAALSPEQARGEHARSADGAALSDAVIEVAHRVRTDSGRLSRGWFERTLASGLSDAEYVETVGIVALVAGLDAFCRALGVAPFPLPPPLPGAPSRRRPEGLESGIAWVPLLAPQDASGPEADVYGGSRFVPNIVRALSLVPDHVRLLRQESASHYLPLARMNDPQAARAIDRLQIELVAARVSALNECFY